MYQHGKRTRTPRSKSAFVGMLFFVGVCVFLGWYLVQKDIGNTDASQSDEPIITEVGSEEGETMRVSEELFTMELPIDWKLQERKLDPGNINAYIWVSTAKGIDDRRLTLHIDTMPATYKFVKMQPLIPNGTGFLLGNISNDCLNFANTNNTTSTAPVPARWENVSFMCDPIKNNQTAGTGTPGGTIGTQLTGTRGTHTYFFFYEDYNIYPDMNVFRDAIESFVAR